LHYDQKSLFYAYRKQVRLGAYSDDKMPELGFFDLVGNDRRYVDSQDRTEACVFFTHCYAGGHGNPLGIRARSGPWHCSSGYLPT
jgi:hypothetical protein